MDNSILLVDEEEELLGALEIYLDRTGYEVIKAENGTNALEAIHDFSPSVAISKSILSDMSGAELLQKAKPLYPDTEFIMISDELDTSSRAKCLALDASDFLYKPISSDVLEIAIQRAIDRQQERRKIREYEKKLEASHKIKLHYQQFFDEMPCYISVQDKNFRITSTNKWFKKDFGDQLGSHCYKVYKHREEPCRPCPVIATFNDGQYHQTEEVVTSRRGEQYNIFTWTAPIHNEIGEIKQVMEMSTNITKIRQLQDHLTSLGLLIGSMSHGIRGLLTGLDGGIYRLESGLKKDDKGKMDDALEVVKDLTGRIKSMVINILYYTKERDLNIVRLSADRFLKDVIRIVSPKAVNHNIDLIYESDSSSGDFEIDTEAVSSSLVNIIENSIDACLDDRSDKESYIVKITLTREKNFITINVCDNGIGMDQETRENLFTLFFSSKGNRGTGLGLFVANQNIKKHGGRIEVESTPGKGSNFKITIPRTIPEESQKARTCPVEVHEFIQ